MLSNLIVSVLAVSLVPLCHQMTHRIDHRLQPLPCASSRPSPACHAGPRSPRFSGRAPPAAPVDCPRRSSRSRTRQLRARSPWRWPAERGRRSLRIPLRFRCKFTCNRWVIDDAFSWFCWLDDWLSNVLEGWWAFSQSAPTPRHLQTAWRCCNVTHQRCHTRTPTIVQCCKLLYEQNVRVWILIRPLW